MAGLVSYVPRESPIHTLHPATKATYFVAAAGCAMLYGQIPVLFVLLLLTLAVLAIGRILPETWDMLRKGLLTVALMIGGIQALFYPGATHVLVALGPLSVKEEGLVFGTTTVLRLFVFVCAFLPLVLATHPSELVAALEERGASPKISYVVLATLQVIPLMQVRASAIVDAQRSRALPTTGSPLVRFRSLIALLGPLLTGSLLDVEQRALALEARGMMLPTKKVRLREVEDSQRDRALRRVFLFALAALVVLRLIAWISPFAA